jgi:hypothetical protein
VATFKQILDSPKFWNFHKPSPKPKPRPPMSAKPYLEHLYAEIWSKFTAHETFTRESKFLHKGTTTPTNYVPLTLSLSLAHL